MDMCARTVISGYVKIPKILDPGYDMQSGSRDCSEY